jgi:ferredoxin
MPVNVLFLPDRLTIAAEAGEPLLAVAERAGVSIPTGCRSGACGACEVEISGDSLHTIRACIATIPTGQTTLSVFI